MADLSISEEPEYSVSFARMKKVSGYLWLAFKWEA